MELGLTNSLDMTTLREQSRQTPRLSGSSSIEEVANEFESLFIKQMLDSMRNTLNRDDSLIPFSQAQDIFEDMLYDEYASMMSSTQSLGIAEMIVSQYSQAESAQSQATAGAAVSGVSPASAAAAYQ